MSAPNLMDRKNVAQEETRKPWNAGTAPNVDILSGIFRDCTQPYKFLFFHALLALTERRPDPLLRFDELLEEMMITAWWPKMAARLTLGNLGANDTLSALLLQLGNAVEEKLSREQAKALAKLHARRERRRGCLRYVPERLLTPWKNASGPPLYSIVEEGILLDPNWAGYVRLNMAILKGWVDGAWLSWMQARNPNVPVTLEKLYQPSRRLSLARERTLFAEFLERRRSVCIYTQAPLTPADFSLDHFLPHSFVGHNRIWNLIPVSKSLNSKKRARIPRASFAEGLLSFHQKIVHDLLAAGGEPSVWLEQYCIDLRVGCSDVANPDIFKPAFLQNILGQMDIARRMGFPGDWEPEAAHETAV